jgi:hypothetical protein
MLAKPNGISALIKLVIVIQAVIAGVYTCLAIYMLLRVPPWPEPESFKYQKWMLGIMLVGFTVIVPWVSFLGLIRSKPWGRNLALFFVWFNLVAIIGSNMEHRMWPDKSEITIGLFFVLFAILLSQKPVCQFFQRPSNGITT